MLLAGYSSATFPLCIQRSHFMDQSSRYADLSLKEADLIAGGRHILCA